VTQEERLAQLERTLLALLVMLLDVADGHYPLRNCGSALDALVRLHKEQMPDWQEDR
jgi:hypothetical protein